MALPGVEVIAVAQDGADFKIKMKPRSDTGLVTDLRRQAGDAAMVVGHRYVVKDDPDSVSDDHDDKTRSVRPAMTIDDR